MDIVADLISKMVPLAVVGMLGYIMALQRRVSVVETRLAVAETKHVHMEALQEEFSAYAKEIAASLKALEIAFAPYAQRRVTDHLHGTK